MTSPYKNSAILENLVPVFESTFKSPANLTKYCKIIESYINENSKILNHNTPSFKLGYDIDPIYKLLNITDQQITAIYKQVKYENQALSRNKVAHNQRYVLLTSLIFYFKFKQKDKATQLTLLYLACVIYSGLYKRYYKYEPNDNIMQYTYNRINSQFLFKRHQTVLKTIAAVTVKNDETNAPRLMKKNDTEIFSYIISLYTRLSFVMKNFAREFYIDQKSKNYLNQTLEVTDDNIEDTDNISYNIESITQKVIFKFAGNPLDTQLIKNITRMNNVPYSTFFNALADMKKNHMDQITIMIRKIISLYLEDSNRPESINSRMFVNKCMNYFRNSKNSKNKEILDIKDILEDLMTKSCPKYVESKRNATKISYKKTLYLYIVLFIANTK